MKNNNKKTNLTLKEVLYVPGWLIVPAIIIAIIFLYLSFYDTSSSHPTKGKAFAILIFLLVVIMYNFIYRIKNYIIVKKNTEHIKGRD